MAEYNIKVTGAEGGVVGRNYTTRVQTIMQDGSSASIQCQTANFNVERKLPEDSKAERIRKRTIGQFEAWNKGMVRTAALGQVLDRLNAGTTWLTIKGNPGEGKTTAGFMALEELDRCGRQVFEVRTPEEFTDVISTCPRPIILLDDVFGNLEFNQMKWSSWEPVVSPLLKEREHKSHEEADTTSKKDVTVVLIGRDYVLNSASVDLERLSDFITSDKHVVCMDQSLERGMEEKRAIWESISRSSGVELDEMTVGQILKIMVPHGFPHVCRLFTTMYKENYEINAIEFFKKPLDFLNKSVANLFKDTDKVKLFQEIVKDEGTVDRKSLRKLDPSYKIIQVANKLVGSYLKCVDDCFSFDHPSIYDSVAFHLCSLDPEFVIKQCHLSFIHERVRLHVSQDTPSTSRSDSRLVVHVDRSYADDLAERFANAIMATNFIHVLSHQAFTDKIFVSKVMSKIKTPMISLVRSKGNTELYSHYLYGYSFLCLVPSSKSPELLKYLDDCPEIELTEDDEKHILYGTCKFAASKVLVYLKDTRKTLNINERFQVKLDHMTPLMIAAESRDVSFVQQIMSLKLDLSAKNKGGETALHYLCKNELWTFVSQAIESGADIDAHDCRHKSVLYYACEYNKLEVVRYLIEKGAKVDSYSLYAACRGASLEIVMLLYKHKNLVVKDTITRCLNAAIKREKIDNKILDFLFSKGASVNGSGTDPGSDLPPLHIACDFNKPGAVDWLLQHGARFDKRDNKDYDVPYFPAGMFNNCTNTLMRVTIQTKCGKSCIHHAPSSEAVASEHVNDKDDNTPHHDAIFREIMNFTEGRIKAFTRAIAQKKDGKTPLHHAAELKSKECVDLLLKAGASVNIKNEKGSTPLHHAAMKGSIESLVVLLNTGVTVNVWNKDANTPFHYAAQSGSKECVDVLLQAGAQVNGQNKEGSTSLHYAALSGSKECVEVLLQAGGQVNGQNKEGNTSLHYAALSGSKECVEVLLQAGAQVNGQDKEGYTSLHYAATAVSNKCIDVLVNAGAEVNLQNEQGTTPIHCAAKKECKVNIDMLLKSGALVNIKDKGGNTPLHYSLEKGSKECVDMLLRAGARVQEQNKDGCSALHYAADIGSEECIVMLLKAGAPVNGQNIDGNTPLHFVARGLLNKNTNVLLKECSNIQFYVAAMKDFYFEGARKCINILLKADAEVNVRNKCGNTPLHLAAQRFDEQRVKAILEGGGRVNIQNRNGDTPFHLLCSSYNSGHFTRFASHFKRVARLLIYYGADADIHNNQGTPALHGNLKQDDKALNAFKDIFH